MHCRSVWIHFKRIKSIECSNLDLQNWRCWRFRWDDFWYFLFSLPVLQACSSRLAPDCSTSIHSCFSKREWKDEKEQEQEIMRSWQWHRTSHKHVWDQPTRARCHCIRRSVCITRWRRVVFRRRRRDLGIERRGCFQGQRQEMNGKGFQTMCWEIQRVKQKRKRWK